MQPPRDRSSVAPVKRERHPDRGRIRVGIGGWTYAPWRGVFYPSGLPQAQELGYASRHLTSIEINATFYGAQKPASFRRWRDETPADFVFAVKGTQFATKRPDPADAGPSIDRFFGTGVLELGPKLGPVLWQFPPWTRFEESAMAAFLELLPHKIGDQPIRHAVEAAHRSFADPRFLDLLRRHGVAAVMAESERHAVVSEPTALFVYARLERTSESVPTGYPPEALDRWAETLRGWAAGGRDCFVYFISGAKIRAPAAAVALIQRLSD